MRHDPEPAPAPMSTPTPVAEPAYASAGGDDDAPREYREHRDTRDVRREPRGEGRRERPRRERGGDGGEGGSGSPEMNNDELMATSKRLTEELLRHMGFEPTVTAKAEGNRVDVTVEVDRDDHLLTGRQGETLQSLQHLLNRFLNKGDGSRYHLQLEVNDHWLKRETELAELARKLADQAVAENAEIVSDHMNSQERRIVHVTLKEDSRVRTYSLGMGMVKRVAVAPASFPERTEDDAR
ncbi:MAG: R3H domain-containing nucleic acid-binding protein [Candidatus Eisenbacteria bacterium]